MGRHNKSRVGTYGKRAKTPYGGHSNPGNGWYRVTNHPTAFRDGERRGLLQAWGWAAPMQLRFATRDRVSVLSGRSEPDTTNAFHGGDRRTPRIHASPEFSYGSVSQEGSERAYQDWQNVASSEGGDPGRVRLSPFRFLGQEPATSRHFVTTQTCQTGFIYPPWARHPLP